MTLTDIGINGALLTVTLTALRLAERALVARKVRNGNGKHSGDLPPSEWKLEISKIAADANLPLEAKVDLVAEDARYIRQAVTTFVESRGKDMNRLFDELRELRNRGK